MVEIGFEILEDAASYRKDEAELAARHDSVQLAVARGVHRRQL